jgi:transposase-like protein
MIEQKVLRAYADGSPLGLIAESFDIELKQVEEILNTYKEENRYKRTFTDEFKNMIAERDINGVARNLIAQELKLNANTVKKSCELFGQTLKEKATSENIFTRIDGDFSIDTCPSCNSKRNNIVDERTAFCMHCNSEHEYHDGYVMKVNFEHLEE